MKSIMLYTLAALVRGLGILIILELDRAAYIVLENFTLRIVVLRYLSIEVVIAKRAFSV
jgi:hypothetical protein